MMNPRHEYITASTTLHKGTNAVLCVTVAAGGAAADLKLYDGEDVKGKLIAHIVVPDGLTGHIGYSRPLYCEKGLHAVVNASTTGVTLQFVPLPPGAAGLRLLALPLMVGQVLMNAPSPTDAPPPPPL